MNVKQFRKRWLNHYIEPELFYMPVKKDNNSDAMIFEIEVYNIKKELRILQIISNLNSKTYYGYTYQQQTLYNLRDINGNKITLQGNPELFTDNPLDNTLFQQDLVEHDKEVFLTIDWGDGEQTFIDKIERKYNEQYLYDTIVGNSLNNPNSNIYVGQHKYKQSGKYTVKVFGVCSCIYIYAPYNLNEDKGWKLLNITSFGNLDVTRLNYTYSSALQDCAKVNCFLNFNKLKKVRSIERLVYNQKLNNTNMTIEEFFEYPVISDWGYIGGDDFFHHFPNLIEVQSALYTSHISYVPSYCFSDNQYLINIDTCFYYCPLKYIGDYACANLKYLSSIRHVFYAPNAKILGKNAQEMVEKWDQYIGRLPWIGDSVFENCGHDFLFGQMPEYNSEIHLGIFVYQFVYDDGVSTSASTYINMCQKIGKKVFKNCAPHLISTVYLGNGYDFLLQSIGDECFADCLSLNIIYFNFKSFCLKSIGDNIFKNCKNLYCVLGNVAMNATLPLEIPDNLLSDIEFQENVEYNFGLRLQYAGYHSINEPFFSRPNDIRTYPLHIFIQDMNNWEPSIGDVSIFEVAVNFLKIYNAEIYSELEEIKNNFPINYYLKFGKNMFNDFFLQQLFKSYENNQKTLTMPIWYDQCFDLYVSENSSEYYNVCCGEAPPFWKYYKPQIKLSNSFSYYGQENYTTNANANGYNHTTPLPVHYDNIDEIPYLINEDINNTSVSTPMNGFNGIGYTVTNVHD